MTSLLVFVAQARGNDDLPMRMRPRGAPRLLNPMNQFRIDLELRVHRVKDRRFSDSLRDQESIKRVAVMGGQCGDMGSGGRTVPVVP